MDSKIKRRRWKHDVRAGAERERERGEIRSDR